MSHHNLSGVEIIGEAPKLVWLRNPFVVSEKYWWEMGNDLSEDRHLILWKVCWMVDDFSLEKQVFEEYFTTILTYRLYVNPALCQM